jgi:hypothetical protein
MIVAAHITQLRESQDRAMDQKARRIGSVSALSITRCDHAAKLGRALSPYNQGPVRQAGRFPVNRSTCLHCSRRSSAFAESHVYDGVKIFGMAGSSVH